VGDAYAAVQWLDQNVLGVPIILEASDTEVSASLSRISSWTGLPTLVGWPGHETQWRGSDEVQRQRLPDIRTIYSTTDPNLAMNLLQRYSVSFVYVGRAERKLYPAEGLAKFERMLPIAFRTGEVTIYRVPSP
jgi:uncharacterized membrane protein